MSMNPSSLPESADSEPHPCPAGEPAGGEDPPEIRSQVLTIIESVMSDSGPEGAGARERLRACLEAHPGQPELALSEHLLALRSLAEEPESVPGGVLSADGSAVSARYRVRTQGAPQGPRARIEAILQGQMLVAAFQPVRELSTGTALGVEAFTRFVSDENDTTGEWFASAAEAGLASELEFAALECALAAAQDLPLHLYVGLKLSPECCVDPLLPELLRKSKLPPDRIILHLNQGLNPGGSADVATALESMRRTGIRLAVDGVGSYAGSIRDVMELRPDIIRLDRSIIAGIDTDLQRGALVEAMIELAQQFGAAVAAGGIETSEELATVTKLGVTAGQGYLLGRPSASPRDWRQWHRPTRRSYIRPRPDHTGQPGGHNTYVPSNG